MRPVLLVTALLAAPVALAQTPLTLTFQANPSQTTLAVGRAECASGQVRVAYALNIGNLKACSALRFWVTTAGACDAENPPTTNDGSNYVFATVTQADLNGSSTSAAARADTKTLDVNKLPIFFNGANTCASDVEAEHKICAAVSYSNDGTSVTPNCSDTFETELEAELTLTYDTKPPEAPRLPEKVASGDRVFRPRLESPAEDVFEYRVVARPTTAGADGGTLAERTSQWTGRDAIAEIRNVENGTAYVLTAVARDAAGNESPPSAEVLATPQPTKGFLDAYDAAGGAETGGCTASGGGLVAVALLAVAGALRARNGRQS